VETVYRVNRIGGLRGAFVEKKKNLLSSGFDAVGDGPRREEQERKKGSLMETFLSGSDGSDG